MSAEAQARQAPFLEAAASIGVRLCRDAAWDGARCNWLGDSLEPVGGAWTTVHRAMGATLYDGTPGIGLFLARLHALTGERPFRTAAEGALRQALSREETFDPAVRIGVHSGLTGVAYALAVAAEALGEEEYLLHSHRVARTLLAVEPAPHAVDVISGSAGAVPVLLWLARLHADGDLRTAAVRHGEFLLGLATRGREGWSWKTLETTTRQDLTGYSHGAAGVALALLELFAETGDERFREGAEEGFRYEAGCFDAREKNWPDYRVFGDPAAPVTCSMAWCHGAPGIGLSRLRAYRLTGEETYRREAEVAIGTTTRSLRSAAAVPGMGYSLCHGEAGNADLLLEASGTLGEPGYRREAEEVGRRGVEWYVKPGSPWPCGVLNAGETPNLMLGTAGIGYFYLRLYDPTVPSVLLLTPGEPRA